MFSTIKQFLWSILAVMVVRMRLQKRFEMCPTKKIVGSIFLVIEIWTPGQSRGHFLDPSSSVDPATTFRVRKNSPIPIRTTSKKTTNLALNLPGQ